MRDFSWAVFFMFNFRRFFFAVTRSCYMISIVRSWLQNAKFLKTLLIRLSISGDYLREHMSLNYCFLRSVIELFLKSSFCSQKNLFGFFAMARLTSFHLKFPEKSNQNIKTGSHVPFPWWQILFSFGGIVTTIFWIFQRFSFNWPIVLTLKKVLLSDCCFF